MFQEVIVEMLGGGHSVMILVILRDVNAKKKSVFYLIFNTKVKLTVEQAIKFQKGGRNIALLFL